MHTSYPYQVPVEATSPWPTFRRDHRNTGASPVAAACHGDQPWCFQTGKGIFSTPIIGGDGTIYVGSADHAIYALDAEGSLRWRFETGEIVDSAGALLPGDAESGPVAVFPSGDGHLYALRASDGAPVWTFAAPGAHYNAWFEGNVAVGPEGTLYAGNTNFHYYAIEAGGVQRWAYATGANAWSNAGFLSDGTLVWGSCDTFVHAVRPDGTRRWRKRTLGFVAASAAIGPDDTVYIGSFDGHLYALDGSTGRTRWRFKTGDHIYASAALEETEDGALRAIYVASTDGTLYALNPDGTVRWTYDTGAPIRSSPALQLNPLPLPPTPSPTLYFGCGNGKLYALDARDGTRRWSFDTTPDDPEMRYRNDLNGSPALGERGVAIGGEHGQVWHVPFDYCLRHPEDPRCDLRPGSDLPDDVTDVVYVNPGGNLEPGARETPPTLPPSAIITLRLLAHEGGRSTGARLCRVPFPRSAPAVRATPPFPLRAEPSADGRYLHVIPERILEPGREYTLHIEGNTYTGGLSIGNLTLGGRKSMRFASEFAFRTAGGQIANTGSFELTRLAVPIPTMLPSLNQIGFDYMDWIVGVAHAGEPDAAGRQKLVLWAIGGRRDARGQLVADPDSDFTLAFSGVLRGGDFRLTNRRFTMRVTGIPIPFDTFQLRGRFGPDLRVTPGATACAETRVLGIPTFGPLLVLAGLASGGWRKLLAAGTYVTRPYDGPAARRPGGIAVRALDLAPPTRTRDGHATATFALEPGAAYPLAQHRAGLLLLDGAAGEAVPLDYHHLLKTEADAAGNLASVTLRIPARTRLPANLEPVVMLDVWRAGEW